MSVVPLLSEGEAAAVVVMKKGAQRMRQMQILVTDGTAEIRRDMVNSVELKFH